MKEVSFIALILLVRLHHGNAMTCEPEHPQAAFCRADFVLKGKLITILPDNKDMMVELMGYKSIDIKIKIYTIYKGRDELKARTGETTTIRTLQHKHNNWSEGKEYLLSGQHSPDDGSNLITQCNWVVEWRKVAFLQRIGLKRYYQMNCACKLNTCFHGHTCTENKHSCMWDIRKESFFIAKDKLDCTSQKSLCWHRGDVKGRPQCRWYTPANLKCKVYEAEDP